MVETTDLECIRQCLEGHPEAFEKLVGRYNQIIFNIAYRMTGDSNAAEDITQNVFYKGYDHLKEYNEKFRFYSWIYRIAINESLNYLKQFAKSSPLDVNTLSSEKNPEEKILESEERAMIRRALMALDPQTRALIVLKHFQDASYKEMACILKVSEKKVKSRLYSARQRLKGILRHEGIVTYD